MTHTCTKVTVRQRAIRNNRISLYLDYYPAVRNPETMHPLEDIGYRPFSVERHHGGSIEKQDLDRKSVV